MVFACKKCKKAFRKDVQQYEESDEYCPHCDNHYVLEAVTPEARLGVEGDDIRKDARMIKDERERQNNLDALMGEYLGKTTERMG